MGAVRYETDYRSLNGWAYNLKIWDEKYSGGIKDFKVGSQAPTIKYDSAGDNKLSPLICSSLEFTFVVENIVDSTWIDLVKSGAYEEKDIYCELKKDSVVVWGGYLIMDLGEEEDVTYPYEIKMRFIDGLALLKEIDFVPSPSTTTAPYTYAQTYLDTSNTTNIHYKSFVWWLQQQEPAVIGD